MLVDIGKKLILYAQYASSILLNTSQLHSCATHPLRIRIGDYTDTIVLLKTTWLVLVLEVRSKVLLLEVGSRQT